MDLKPPSRPDHRDCDHSFPLPPPSASDLPGWELDSWVDPHEEHLLLRRRLRRYHLGFSCLGLALVVASLSTIGSLILFFRQMGPLGAQLGIPHWELIEQSLVVWPSLLGVLLLTGPWPDRSWQRRSVLLFLMCVVDAIVWTLDHAGELGLSEGEIGHKWLRHSITTTIGWSEFALIASLAADMAAHLGESQAIDFAKAVRSLATTGAMTWFMYFYFTTNWRIPPLWPLRQHGHNATTVMLYLSWVVLATINFVQTSALTLLAGRSCGRALREMAKQERAKDLLPSRSEEGWKELNKLSGPKGDA